MRVIIAGCRDWDDANAIADGMAAHYPDCTQVVCGCAKGADRLGDQWAKNNQIPVRYFAPDWIVHGKAAGPIRNGIMADNADALLACWDGESRGTKNMIAQARQRGLKVVVIERAKDANNRTHK